MRLSSRAPPVPAPGPRIDRAAAALTAHGFTVEILEDAAAARTRVAELIPPGAEVFDLSLAILCDGRHQRARRTYTDGLDRLAARHPLRVRGYLQVARLDLWQAVRDWPELRGAPVVEQIEADLNGALAKLPAPPVLPFASSR